MGRYRASAHSTSAFGCTGHAKTSANTVPVFLSLTKGEAVLHFAASSKSKWLILQEHCQGGDLLVGFYFQGSCDQATFEQLLCMFLFFADSQILNSWEEGTPHATT